MTAKRKLTQKPSSSRQSKRTHQADGLSIFISYASEDQPLATEIRTFFKTTFNFAPLKIFLDAENIGIGNNYQQAIDNALDEADILLLLVTGRMKRSHTYTGFEVGYFTKSIHTRPESRQGQQRIIIPLCIGSATPDMLHFIQGILVSNGHSSDTSKPIKPHSRENDREAVRKMIKGIHESLQKLLGNNAGDMVSGKSSELVEEHTTELLGIVRRYAETLISSVIYPERKLVISFDNTPTSTRTGIDMSNATVALYGDFSPFLSFHHTIGDDQPVHWERFVNMIPEATRTKLVSGIEHLIGSILNKIGDNYHIITDENQQTSFRLFVSKVVKYFNKKTEIDIYAVSRISREYGDPVTTRLLKLASAGLRFRFLMLEQNSQFTPERMGHPIVDPVKLKQAVLEMQSEIAMIQREADQADVNDPSMFIEIFKGYDETKIEKMMTDWNQSKTSLDIASDTILFSKNAADFNRQKKELIRALTSFRKSVDTMNRDFTSRVLHLLINYVK